MNNVEHGKGWEGPVRNTERKYLRSRATKKKNTEWNKRYLFVLAVLLRNMGYTVWYDTSYILHAHDTLSH